MSTKSDRDASQGRGNLQDPSADRGVSPPRDGYDGGGFAGRGFRESSLPRTPTNAIGGSNYSMPCFFSAVAKLTVIR